MLYRKQRAVVSSVQGWLFSLKRQKRKNQPSKVDDHELQAILYENDTESQPAISIWSYELWERFIGLESGYRMN